MMLDECRFTNVSKLNNKFTYLVMSHKYYVAYALKMFKIINARHIC